jgi:hypothetical protein
MPFHTDGWIATVSAAIARPTGRHGGFPTGRPWAYAFPSPFLGSTPLGIPLPEHSRLIGLDLSVIGSLSLRGGQTTGGDSNPDCLTFGVFAPIIIGWPGRWPPTFAVPAFDCFARSFAFGKPDCLSGAFSFFAGHFRARRRGKIYPRASEIPRFFQTCNPLIHRLAQLLAGTDKSRCIIWWII